MNGRRAGAVDVEAEPEQGQCLCSQVDPGAMAEAGRLARQGAPGAGPAGEAADAGEAGRDAGPAQDARLQGHWLLASLGKRVLRPGGRGLTRRLLDRAYPSSHDRIVEFGPGVGLTAGMLLAVDPVSYTGVDPNPEGRAQLDAVLDGNPRARVVTADAAETTLPDASADLIVGEAMLTMCPPAQRRTILAEAWRVLDTGGRYAVHELALTDQADDPDENARGPVGRDLSARIKVGARPLKIAAWRALFEEAGFEVVWVGCAPMRLLDPGRIIADEGIIGSVRFLNNLRRRPEARRRVLAMREGFKAHKDDLTAVGIVLRKP